MYLICTKKVSTASNAEEKSALKGKLSKSVVVKILLFCSLCTDSLAETENFSDRAQRSNVNILSDIIVFWGKCWAKLQTFTENFGSKLRICVCIACNEAVYLSNGIK